MQYLTNTFSPMMISPLVEARVKRITLAEATALVGSETTDAISHETTAPVVGALIGRKVNFNRVNITLNAGDTVIAVIPNFRTSEAREFTKEEVEAAGFNCFLVDVV